MRHNERQDVLNPILRHLQPHWLIHATCAIRLYPVETDLKLRLYRYAGFACRANGDCVYCDWGVCDGVQLEVLCG